MNGFDQITNRTTADDFLPEGIVATLPGQRLCHTGDNESVTSWPLSTGRISRPCRISTTSLS